ncbi:endonuclease/exonuclease/phosphatase family protein [Jannaschia rubra]|uniref:Endonuclease/Exonuclease/phosphatase family protein n=1 Tax=Jannaschia rubra TaxID=282197 RepID=A0A0M6XT64_9RHOB|nr:endonuclease/exonuclease/phosphatase family protein [Jannaschia rubra]CTQ33797.1 Endonuclease/Exonuclease/phosphatase family protein [Jannaschia rubra]SFG09307.1 Endonuclease/Exonuclease/phosphatase family protein [Jannaschia rubra]
MTFRLVTWNVEWFDRLFRDDGTPDATDDWSARYGVTKARQLDAVAHVLRHVDADAVLVVEAPDDSPSRSTRVALETFAEDRGLRVSRAMIGFANDTRQELALMFDPARVTPRHAPGEADDAPRFDRMFGFDLDSDLRAEHLVWSKPPVELDLVTPIGPLHLIGVHAKSKSAHGASDPQDALRLNILNRRKQLAQCVWLRRRVDQHLAQGRSLIVAGDFNDGPGLDAFETLFGRSGVEIVLGSGGNALFDPSARPPRIGAALPSTARFWDNGNRRYLNALLDFAMVSPDLRPRATWRILHPFDDAEATGDAVLRQALLDASDHFPVILDLAPTDPTFG